MRNFLWSQGMDGEGGDSDGDNEISELTFFISLFQATAPIGVSWRYWYEIIQHDKRKNCVQRKVLKPSSEWVVSAGKPLSPASAWKRWCHDMTCLFCPTILSSYDTIWHEIWCEMSYLPFAAKAPGLWQEIQSMAEVPGKEIIWHLHH